MTVFYCALENRLYAESSCHDRQTNLLVASQILDLLKRVLVECSLTPTLQRLLKLLLVIAKQANAVSLVEKATECIVILVCSTAWIFCRKPMDSMIIVCCMNYCTSRSERFVRLWLHLRVFHR